MSAMLLLIGLDGRRAAIPAERVISVLELGRLAPIPRAPVHVAGLSTLRSRPLTVIDCRASLGLGRAELSFRPRAVVVEQDGHLYGLLVDAADEVVEALDQPTALAMHPGPGWDRIAQAMVESEAGPVLLLDVAALVEGPPLAAAA